MTCDSLQSYIEAYVDGELDPANSLDMERHLSSCDACSSRRARVEALRTVIASQAPRYRAPDSLRSRIQSNLRSSADPGDVRKKRVFDWKWAAIAASVLFAMSLFWQMQSHRGQDHDPTFITSEIVSSHVRSLMVNHLVDEPSSDQHTVKPWFAGKLDFSPDVKNLDAQGFPLAGGRLDYIGNRTVAAIVYRRRQHVINVFVWPLSRTPTRLSDTVTVNGFSTVHWISGGLSYSAVSDLNRQELELFSHFWSHD